MGCDASKEKQVTPPGKVSEGATHLEDAPTADKMKFRQATVKDMLADERTELERTLLRWASKVFKQMDKDGKGQLDAKDLAELLKKLPSKPPPTLPPVSLCCACVCEEIQE